jgi:hypothetical protein
MRLPYKGGPVLSICLDLGKPARAPFAFERSCSKNSGAFLFVRCEFAAITASMKSQFNELRTSQGIHFMCRNSASDIGKTRLATAAVLLLLLVGCEKNTTSPETAIPSQSVAPQETAAAQMTSNESAGQSPQASTDRSYTYGTVVNFGRGGDGKRYQVSGWSGTEQLFTWTDGTTAVLAFKILPTESPLTLRMSLEGLTGVGLPSQPVRVEANGKEIATWDVAAKRDYTAVIPADVLRGSDTLTITLHIPKAATPTSLGQNKDQRLLGVHCFELEIAKQ